MDIDLNFKNLRGAQMNLVILFDDEMLPGGGPRGVMNL